MIISTTASLGQLSCNAAISFSVQAYLPSPPPSEKDALVSLILFFNVH